MLLDFVCPFKVVRLLIKHQSILLIWIVVGQEPTVVAVGAGWGCLDIFSLVSLFFLPLSWGGRVVRWCCINFQCRSVLLIWIRVGQGPTALAVGAGGGCLDIFTLVYHFFFLSPTLWETARYRLKYCLKGPLSPKQPANPSLRETTRYRLKYCLNRPLVPKQPGVVGWCEGAG